MLGFNRQPAKASVQRGQVKSKSYQFPAPTRGWIRNESLAIPQPGGAAVLDNWTPTTNGIRLRGGNVRHATLEVNTPVQSLAAYLAGQRDMFGMDEENIYEITAPGSPNTPVVPVVTGQTSGYYSTIPFTTAGGDFLYFLNGTDDPQLYDGTTFTAINAGSTPAITGVTSADLIQGCAYRDRLFFVEKNSLNVWYPAVNALGGALENITLTGTYRKGGRILFVAPWSFEDAGQGIDDKLVVMSTEGEVAVFQGANPSGTTAADWTLVGVYSTSRALGKNAWTVIGGDLLILTEEGIVPMTQIVQKDPAALSLSAVSRAIEPEWKDAVSSRRALPWEMVKWPEKNMAIVNVPRVSVSDMAICFVVNLETGAWARYTGWDVRCLVWFDGQVYFGSNDGRVRIAETGGNDDGSPYVCTYIGLAESMNMIGLVKMIRQGRATFVATEPFSPQLTVLTNYSISQPNPPNSIPDYSRDNWDQALWDVALWDNGPGNEYPVFRWVSIGRTGFAISPCLQVTCGVTPTPAAELVGIEFTMETGGLVV